MSRIVLATMGSLGDLHPYVAVGIGLKQRGHDVVIATTEAYRSKVRGEGLEFHPVRPDLAPVAYTPETYDRANDMRTGTTFLLRELVLPNVEITYGDLLAACCGADLLCIHPILFPAPVVAEKLKLKWLSIALAPSTFVSAYDPPVLPPFPWLHGLRRLGPVPNRAVFGLFRKLTRSWMKPIDELRKREGLPAARKHPIHDGMFSPYGTLGWFSPVFGTPQPDWPERTRLTGFVYYDRLEPGQTLDPELEKFLDEGPPPVVFTLGSSAVMSSDGFYRHSLEAVRRAGCRAVFLAGTDPRNQPQGEVPAGVLFHPYAPYSELFPGAAAVVHSGGAGTTAQSMRAGLPMLVTPFTHDQPDNAFRVQRLGIGRVLERKQYNAERAEKLLTELLERPEYTRRAREVGERLRREDGVASACDAVEECLELNAPVEVL